MFFKFSVNHQHLMIIYCLNRCVLFTTARKILTTLLVTYTKLQLHSVIFFEKKWKFVRTKCNVQFGDSLYLVLISSCLLQKTKNWFIPAAVLHTNNLNNDIVIDGGR